MLFEIDDILKQKRTKEEVITTKKETPKKSTSVLSEKEIINQAVIDAMEYQFTKYGVEPTKAEKYDIINQFTLAYQKHLINPNAALNSYGQAADISDLVEGRLPINKGAALYDAMINAIILNIEEAKTKQVQEEIEEAEVVEDIKELPETLDIKEKPKEIVRNPKSNFQVAINQNGEGYIIVDSTLGKENINIFDEPILDEKKAITIAKEMSDEYFKGRVTQDILNDYTEYVNGTIEENIGRIEEVIKDAKDKIPTKRNVKNTNTKKEKAETEDRKVKRPKSKTVIEDKVNNKQINEQSIIDELGDIAETPTEINEDTVNKSAIEKLKNLGCK